MNKTYSNNKANCIGYSFSFSWSVCYEHGGNYIFCKVLKRSGKIKGGGTRKEFISGVQDLIQAYYVRQCWLILWRHLGSTNFRRRFLRYSWIETYLKSLGIYCRCFHLFSVSAIQYTCFSMKEIYRKNIDLRKQDWHQCSSSRPINDSSVKEYFKTVHVITVPRFFHLYNFGSKFCANQIYLEIFSILKFYC